MLIFGLHDGERITLDVNVGMTVKEVKEMLQELLNISVDQYKHDKKVLVLSWAGSDLQDPWVFSDLGIVPGSTIRVHLREEVKPVLHIHCSHSQDTISLYDNLVIGHMHLDELRSLVTRKTGLPVGIFRLVTKSGTEMYDGHRLEDYGIDVGHTILLENLDGWNEFLNLAVMGFTPQVVSQISQEENMGRYQMKVALFLAAHHGHVDLARAMLRQGMKASEPIGYPPQRMWCTEDGHIDSKKAAVHEAVEMGQLGVLRLFVNNDITVITAKDGNGLAPLNIALRKKIKNCASFLLTKQWSKVNVTKHFAIHIGTYTHLRQWCDLAKERAFMKYGHSKSTLKRRPFQSGPLVGFGVNVDGYSPSIMTGKSKAQLQREKEREKKKLLPRQSMPQMTLTEAAAGNNSTNTNTNTSSNNPTTTSDPEAYFKQMNAVQSLKSMGDKAKLGRWGRMARIASRANLVEPLTSRSQGAAESRNQRSPEPPKVNGEGDETVRLPPIMQKLRARLLAQSGATSDVTQRQTSVTADVKEPSSQQQQPQQQQQQQQQVSHVPQPPGEKKEEKSMMSKLVKSRGSAYFMAGGAQQQQQQQQQAHAPGGPVLQPLPQQSNAKASTAAGGAAGGPQLLPPNQAGGGGKVPNIHIPSSDRSEVESQAETVTSRIRGSVYGGAESLDTASTVTTGEDGLNLHASSYHHHHHHHHHHLPRKDTLRSTTRASEPLLGDASTSRQPATDESGTGTKTKTKKKQQKKQRGKNRVSSALLLSKAKSSEGTIPLPLISNEQDRRPFFYYNGKREDDFIDPTINTWSKHTHSAGTTPRERAIKSLTMANTFKDKPWLGQVRIALQIASNPTKRTVVRRLRSASKRAFAIK